MNKIGWIGSLLLVLCGAPQAYQSWIEGHSKGINIWFLASWLLGELLMFIYNIMDIKNNILLFNYIGNILFIFIIVYYKLYPRT